MVSSLLSDFPQVHRRLVVNALATVLQVGLVVSNDFGKGRVGSEEVVALTAAGVARGQELRARVNRQAERLLGRRRFAWSGNRLLRRYWRGTRRRLRCGRWRRRLARLRNGRVLVAGSSSPAPALLRESRTHYKSTCHTATSPHWPRGARASRIDRRDCRSARPPRVSEHRQGRGRPLREKSWPRGSGRSAAASSACDARMRAITSAPSSGAAIVRCCCSATSTQSGRWVRSPGCRSAARRDACTDPASST